MKVAEYDYDYMHQFFKEIKTMYAKLVPEAVPYISFTSIYLESFIYLSFMYIIYWDHPKKYFLQFEYHIELVVHQ